ncbi:MAG TPA: hypothetical protein ENN80_01825 [Candidatus Hydrogenedentes bacterium]|nr:hypothetical protein [Candidatus Hydrogenedentota bacterium]
MKATRIALFPVLCCGLAAALDVNVWVSTQDMAKTLSAEAPLSFVRASPSDASAIHVDPAIAYQPILGMGASLDHATCFNISRLEPAAQDDLIERIVSPEKGIGMNLMRICIGTSDFAPLPYYSYDDIPEGEIDPDLEHFSIEADRDYYLPILKKALAVNPELWYFASPWSPPGWMKKGGALGGGVMLEQWLDIFARYLAAYVEAYRDEGIHVYALTPQNEPGMVHPGYPTCLWRADMQRDFIKRHLGPLFAEKGLDTRIWCFDHNFNNLAFPRTVLSDPDAARYVEATAFHHYEGLSTAMAELHAEFPHKHIYFTEGSTFGIRGALRIVDFFRNWAESYNAWVTVLDENQQPNSGPHHASPTCIVRHSRDNTVEYRFDYYMYGQFMKFVRRGAVRIDSTQGDRMLNNVAFRNHDGSIVLVVANHSGEKELCIVCDGQMVAPTVPARSVTTFVWRPAM